VSAADLSQAEADRLIGQDKSRKDDTVWDFPDAGSSLKVPLISVDGTEEFLLDVTRSQILVTKGTFQTRWQSVVILVRLDIDGPPHRNPDGTDIPCPHLHLYREGYGDKWARPVTVGEFPGLGDLFDTCTDFMTFCSVVTPPRIQRTLFT